MFDSGRRVVLVEKRSNFDHFPAGQANRFSVMIGTRRVVSVWNVKPSTSSECQSMTGNGFPPHTTEGRLESILGKLEAMQGLLQQVAQRNESGLAELAARLDAQADDRRKEWYSVAEFAALLERKPSTVRDWCRLGRLKATKRSQGRGFAKDWEISREEFDRYRNHGLRPLQLLPQK